MNTYVAGNLIRSSVAFANSLGAAVDPTAVKLKVRTPLGVTTVLIYGTDVEIVKASTGNYYADINAYMAGTWYVRWYSTGTGQAAAESSFLVSASVFTLPGATGVTYTDVITDGMDPVAGVRVEFSTDLAGANRIHEAYTDAEGRFTLYADAGTYYRWIDRDNYTGTQGVQVVLA